jgi:type I restriction enzyme S subunit
MSCNWPRFTIQELIDSQVITVQKDGNHGSNYPRASEFGDKGVAFLTAKLLDDAGNIDFAQAPRLSEEKAAKFKFGFIEKDDVLLSHNATVGRVAIVPNYGEKVLIGTSLTHYRLNSEKLLPQYLAAFFTSKDFQNQLAAVMSQTTRNQVPITAQRKLEVVIPPIKIQEQLTRISGSIIEKISLNTQTNQTLEEMAQAIFKSWFVDFDPVKAKMNGEEPEGMDAATASLFPEKLVESELGLIPEGWEVLESQKVATVAIGKTPPRKEPQWFSENPSDVTWISIKDMGNAGTYALDSSEYLTPEAVDKFNVKVIPDNTLILSFKLTVGRVAITHGEMTTNEAIAHYKLADDARVSTNFLYSYMKQFNFESLGSTSSIAKAVNSKIIKALPVIVPSKEILDSFDTLVKPLFNKIKSNQMENQNLEALRDTLLPKLLSGEIELETK